MDAIKYNCPNCGHGLSIPAQYSGQRGTCKHCNHTFTVPKVGAPLPPVGAPPLPTFNPLPNSGAARPNVRTEYRSFIGGFWGCIGVGVAICTVCAVAIGGCIFLYQTGAREMERERLANSASTSVASADAPRTDNPSFTQILKNAGSFESRMTETASNLSLVIHAKGVWESDNQFQRPKQNMVFYAVDIELKNNGTSPCDVNSFGFALVDTANREYKQTFGCPDPEFPMKQLLQGQSARGWVCFEAMVGCVPAKITFAPNMFAAARTEISL